MSTELFDTLEAAEALTSAGIAEAQAKAIVATVRKAVSGGVATKGDIGELRTEIGAVRGEVGTVKAELKGDIGAVKAELWAIKWVLGFMFAIIIAMAARLFGVV